MAPITIKEVKVITTQPGYSRLIVVKVITSEPGLYGLGCATFTQRWRAVVAALEGHIIPFVIGRDVTRIEETFRMLMVNGYWRNGGVLDNAISGIDEALWDIKGKMAKMPVYQLLGGSWLVDDSTIPFPPSGQTIDAPAAARPDAATADPGDLLNGGRRWSAQARLVGQAPAVSRHVRHGTDG